MIGRRWGVRRNRQVRDERGVALLAAVVALVVIGALVAGSFFASALERRTAQNVVVAALAHEAAEAGLEDALANARAGDFPFGPADSTAYTANVAPAGWAGGTSYSVWVFPLSATMYLLKSRGTANGITSTLGAFVKPATANAPVAASLTVASPVTFDGTSFRIDGANTNPPVAAGCPPTPTPPQVYALRSQTGTGVGPTDWANVVGPAGAGAPAGQGSAVAADPAVGPLMTALFGSGGTFDELRAAATWSFAPGIYAQRQPSTTAAHGALRCDIADDRNWGEPRTGPGTTPECRNYFPIILGSSAFGSPLEINGGRGQGILLADGDLVLTGGFEWAGLILVKGSIKFLGGATVLGAVVAQNAAAAADNVLAGTTQITYSSCAVSRALNAIASFRPASTRAWTQLF